MVKKDIGSPKTGIVSEVRKSCETIEMKMARILERKEPITDGAPLIYTERKDGVLPMYDIRTDRFDKALEDMDRAVRAKIARREEFHKTPEQRAAEAAAAASAESNGTDGGKPAA